MNKMKTSHQKTMRVHLENIMQKVGKTNNSYKPSNNFKI